MPNNHLSTYPIQPRRTSQQAEEHEFDEMMKIHSLVPVLSTEITKVRSNSYIKQLETSHTVYISCRLNQTFSITIGRGLDDINLLKIHDYTNCKRIDALLQKLKSDRKIMRSKGKMNTRDVNLMLLLFITFPNCMQFANWSGDPLITSANCNQRELQLHQTSRQTFKLTESISEETNIIDNELKFAQDTEIVGLHRTTHTAKYEQAPGCNVVLK